VGKPRRSLRPFLILAGALALCGEAVQASMVFGTVADNPSFLPIEGAWVYLAGRRPGLDSTQTDSSGSYRFSEVTDCGMACEVLVRMPGFWPFQSQAFDLGPNQNLQLDIQLALIHSLTVRVVKAEDTSQPILNAHAVVFASEFDPPRCEAADSAGRMDFRELHSFTAHRLTVSAPGRQATTNYLSLHGTSARVFWKAVLEVDSAHTDKSVRGALSAKDGLPFPGARALLSCRSGSFGAGLFAEAGTDGVYAIEGVPEACDSAMLYAGSDSLALALTEKDTHLDWAIGVSRPTGLLPARARTARRVPRTDRTGAYDLVGRKSDAGRARLRRIPRR
jgi:hypothetical protein